MGELRLDERLRFFLDAVGFGFRQVYILTLLHLIGDEFLYFDSLEVGALIGVESDFLGQGLLRGPEL